MDWNEEMITRLSALWSDGHSTAEIGRRLGITKNAVVGKAHRMNLKPRPSPIRWSEAAVRRVSAVPVSAPASILSVTAPQLAPAAAAPARPHAVFQPVSPPRQSLRVSSCCWPIGEPGTVSFRFCDGDATAGRPYCAEHAQLAYVKVRDRRDTAA